MISQITIFQHYDIGSIYVFRNDYVADGKFQLKAVSQHSMASNDDIQVLLRPAESLSSGARYGAALANLGRLDADRFDDFAVGAPYENNGMGSIYIYRGWEHFWTMDDRKHCCGNITLLLQKKCIIL